MNNNRSFVVTLLLAVGSGVMIGLMVFGMTGKGGQPAPAAAPATNAAAAPSSAPSPAPGGDEPMAPVQYDSPDGSGGATAPPEPSATAPRNRPVLM